MAGGTGFFHIETEKPSDDSYDRAVQHIREYCLDRIVRYDDRWLAAFPTTEKESTAKRAIYYPYQRRTVMYF